MLRRNVVSFVGNLIIIMHFFFFSPFFSFCLHMMNLISLVGFPMIVKTDDYTPVILTQTLYFCLSFSHLLFPYPYLLILLIVDSRVELRMFQNVGSLIRL